MKHVAFLSAVLATILLLQFAAPSDATSNNSDTVSILAHYTFLLPGNFTGHPAFSFVNGTLTFETSFNALLANAAETPFVSFDDASTKLLGPDPTPHPIEQRSSNFAGEAGVWYMT